MASDNILLERLLKIISHNHKIYVSLEIEEMKITVKNNKIYEAEEVSNDWTTDEESYIAKTDEDIVNTIRFAVRDSYETGLNDFGALFKLEDLNYKRKCLYNSINILNGSEIINNEKILELNNEREVSILNIYFQVKVNETVLSDEMIYDILKEDK